MNTKDLATISSASPKHPGINYEVLRKEGLSHLQRMAGNLWTDYNSHDPGVTILEQLCYVLTDLSYRTGYEMPDLLAVKEGDPYRCLYTPARILTTKPVTVVDLRKVLVDIKGVQNAWIEALEYPNDYFYYDTGQRTLTFNPLVDGLAKTKGFYRILIQKDKEESVNDSLLLQQVKKCIQSNRQLCEDVREVRLLPTQKVHCKATIEVGAVENADLLLAQIYRNIADYISPYIRFHTLGEMQNKGKRIDEIMEGPVLQHGFIDTETISKLNRRKDLRISDFVQEVMKAKGVEVIKNISLYSEKKQADWVLALDSGKVPEFDVENSEITFVRGDYEIKVNKTNVIALYRKLKENTQYPVLKEKDRNIVLPKGNVRNIEHYDPFQNYFPTTYGVGEPGLASSDPKRKGQAKQLKAYLLFFEQLLANYFSQIAHFKDLMDFFNPDIKSYFAQRISGIPEMDTLLQHPNAYENKIIKISKDKDIASALDRKNRFLDHLMARFCETFTDYSLIAYGAVEKEQYSPLEKQVKDKQNVLKEYPENSASRGNAFDYTQAANNSANVSGLKKRLANLLGIPNHSKDSLVQRFKNVKAEIDTVYRNVKDKNIYDVLKLGLSTAHYTFNPKSKKIEIVKKPPESGFKVSSSLQFTDANVLAETGNEYTAATYAEAVKVLISQWQQWNSSLEGFYMMEHILLCPQTGEQGGAFLKFVSDITATASSRIGNGVKCTSPGHNLTDGEEIELFDAYYTEGTDSDGNPVRKTGSYNGTYQIYNVQKDHFEIKHQNLTEPSNKAKWVRTRLYTEPYSLQLSFVLPDWPARFRNTGFKKFIEKTIRLETPAHIQVYIRWFSRFGDIPDTTWNTEEIRGYLNRVSILHSSAEDQQSLLNRIPLQTTMEQWEKDYFLWLQKKVIHTGQPDKTWSKNDIQKYMQDYGIKYLAEDTITELCRKTDSFIQNVQKWKLLYKAGTPDAKWAEKDLKALMDIFGISHRATDSEEALIIAINRFEENCRQWFLLRNTADLGTLPTEQLWKWMDIFHLPYSQTDSKTHLLEKITKFRTKAPLWVKRKEFPTDSWTDNQLKTLMTEFSIPYNTTDNSTDLKKKIIQYDQDCRHYEVWSSPPDNTWDKTRLELYMYGFGIPYKDTDTTEKSLAQIVRAEGYYRKWDLLKGALGNWVFPENTTKWTEAKLRQFADEFAIPYENGDTKLNLVKAITQFQQQVVKRLETNPHGLQYHADKLTEHLKMGKILLPYALDETNTIHFSSDQRIDLTNFGLADSGTKAALGSTATQTIEMWIKPATITGNQKLYSKTMSLVQEKIVLNAQGRLEYHYNTNTTMFSPVIPTDYWTHVAVIRNTTGVSFVINGKGTDNAITIQQPGSPGTLTAFFIGGTTDNPYTGKIAEVRVWNIARTTAVIDRDMQSSLIGNEAQLSGYWKLNENLGNVAIDSTSNSNQGIITKFLSNQVVQADNTITATPATVNRGGQSLIKIKNSRQEVMYQLRAAGNNTHQGSAKKGNGGDLTFEISNLQTTQTFNVLAVKTTNHQLEGTGEERLQLDQTVSIQVTIA